MHIRRSLTCWFQRRAGNDARVKGMPMQVQRDLTRAHADHVSAIQVRKARNWLKSSRKINSKCKTLPALWVLSNTRQRKISISFFRDKKKSACEHGVDEVTICEWLAILRTWAAWKRKVPVLILSNVRASRRKPSSAERVHKVLVIA